MKILTTPLLAAAIVLSAPASSSDTVTQYRSQHEWEIVQELANLVAIPNDGTSDAILQPNIDALKIMLQRRGFVVERVRHGSTGAPSIIATLKRPGKRKTIGFYAHFDGQPVTASDWASPPFQPTLRTGAGLDSGTIDLGGPKQRLQPDYRLFGRSTSDDKGPIVAILTAIDALQSSMRDLPVDIVLYLDGEEERGSPDLDALLKTHAAKLRADLWLLCDGPVHSSGAQQVLLGARGFAAFELTAYGPQRALHSGHYGNWAPNPAVALARLISAMRGEDGEVTIPGFADGAEPVSAEEAALLAQMPEVEQDLRASLQIGRTKGKERLLDSIMRPSLNIRGLSAGGVGDNAVNAIPTQARASIDLRLVPGQRPERVREAVENFMRAQGWHLTLDTPSPEVLRAYPKVLRVQWTDGYAGYRGSPTQPAARLVVGAISTSLGHAPIVTPMMGGSIPMAVLAERLDAPVLMVPTVNPDNNQHGPNENIRLQNLWNGITIYAAIMTALAEAK